MTDQHGAERRLERRLEEIAERWTERPPPAGLWDRVVAAVPARRRRRRWQRSLAGCAAVVAVVSIVGLLGGVLSAQEPMGSVRVGATPESFRSDANAICRGAAAERAALAVPAAADPIEVKVAHVERLRAIADREIAAIGGLAVPEKQAAIVAAMVADAAESTRLFDELLPAYVRTLETGEPLSAHDRAVARALDELGRRIESAIGALGLDDCGGGQ